MTKKSLLFLLLLFFTTTNIFSQASWSFTVFFSICNNEKDMFTKEDFLNGKIKLYSHPFGIHSNQYLGYNERLKMFVFDQGTIASGSMLVFEVDDEIMVLRIPTHNLQLNEIVFEPGQFCFNAWKNEEIFNRIEVDKWQGSAWSPKHEISHYKCAEKVSIDIERLEEIKIQKEND